MNKASSLRSYMPDAKQQLQKTGRNEETFSLDLQESAEKLRWFVLPHEITQQESNRH